MIDQEPIAEDHYTTLAHSGESIFKDRGSKFIGLCFPAANTEEAMARLEEVKAQYHDARHHCYAYRIKPKSPQIRINDDGEPANSAGTPIYNQILSESLWNVIVVVVRYFGGTKLGVPGLINAYKTAAHEALTSVKKREIYYYQKLEVRFPYADMSLAMSTIKESGAEIVDEMMEADAGYLIKCRDSQAQSVLNKLKSLNSLTIKPL